jgi:streptomycin 6-kinase
MTNDKLDDYLQLWQLANPQLLAETVTSRVYTVSHAGTTVVLKILKPYGVEERMGALALRHFEGRGAVRLLRADDDAHLLEYASSEDLTGLVKNGQDAQATEIIANVINTLHADQTDTPPEGITTLRRWFRALFTRAEKEHHSGQDSIIVRAAARADTVLAQPRDVRVLHGDIHHQNIRQSPRGWLLFDPKGVYGERTYDLANTLCNPPPEYGVNAVDETRILAHAEILARTCQIELPRVLLFLHLYACLSASWTLEDAAGGWGVAEILTIAEIAERHMETP